MLNQSFFGAVARIEMRIILFDEMLQQRPRPDIMRPDSRLVNA